MHSFNPLYRIKLTACVVTPETGYLDQRGSITFGTFTGQDAPYTAKEVPFFILLGIFGGLVGAAFNQLNERLTVWRKAHVVKYTLQLKQP